MGQIRPLFVRRHGVLPRYPIKIARLNFQLQFLGGMLSSVVRGLSSSIKFLLAVSVLTNILFSTCSSILGGGTHDPFAREPRTRV